jgi:outer membrane protein TolC
MKRITTRVGAALIAGLLALPAQATPPPTLAAAVDAAWQRAEAAQAAVGEQRAASAAADSVGRWWAEPPAIALSQRTDRWQSDAGQREYQVHLTFPLWLPGQRRAYSQAAADGLAQAGALQRATRWRLAGEVRESGWRLVAMQAQAAQMAAAAASLQRLAADVRRRVEAGELPRTDLLAAQAEELAARNRHGSAELQVREAALEWRSLTGLDSLPDAAALAENLPAEIGLVAEHPALQEAAGEAAGAASQRDLVRTQRSAAPELSVGWSRSVGGRGNAAADSLVIGVRMPLGADERNKPLLARAEAAADVARTRELRQREQVQASLRLAREGLSLAEAQATAAQAQVRLLRERSELLERAFAVGELALPELLRALAAAGEAATYHARQQAELGLARARLLQSLGQHP